MSLVTLNGNPLVTNMSWNHLLPRPTNQQLLDSSLGPVIASLQGAPFVRPDDLGLTPPAGMDETEVLQWALLVSRVLGVPLWINRQFRYSGVLEIQEGQTVYGNGPYRPGLRMDVKSIIESQNIAIVKTYTAASLCHAPGVDKFTIRDLQIDGGQYDIDWATIAASGQYATDLSQVLRESPSYSGFAPHNQNGRNIPKEVILESVHIHDTLGTCMFGVSKNHARNITLGNTVSGRILYRFFGECFGLQTYGFSRTSVARVNAGCIIDGWTYEGRGLQNPWPENDYPENICAIEKLSGVEGPVELRNINWDGTGSAFTQSFKTNVDCIVTGRIKKLRGPYVSGAVPGPYSLNWDLQAVDCAPFNLAADRKANVRNAKVRWVHRSEARDKYATDWGIGNYSVWSKLVEPSLEIAVARQPHHAADHEQRINIHIDHDWPQWLVLHFPDLMIDPGTGLRVRTPAEVIPTYVTLSGRIDNQLAAWIGVRTTATQQYAPQPGELEALPIRVIFNGLACNTIPPGPLRGDNPHTVHSGIWLDLAQFRLYSTVIQGLP